jgi:hypothetical protein
MSVTRTCRPDRNAVIMARGQSAKMPDGNLSFSSGYLAASISGVSGHRLT